MLDTVEYDFQAGDICQSLHLLSQETIVILIFLFYGSYSWYISVVVIAASSICQASS